MAQPTGSLFESDDPHPRRGLPVDPSADRAARMAATRDRLSDWYRPRFAPDRAYEPHALRLLTGGRS